MNTYTCKFTITCPNDGEQIEYTLTIESGQMILVEEINATVERVCAQESVFQEDLAEQIFCRLPGKQTITAVHQGIHVETVRGELRDEKKLSEAIEKGYFRYGVGDWDAVAKQVMRAMK